MVTSAGAKLSALLTDHLGTAHTSVELGGSQPVTRRSFKPYGELRGPKPSAWPDKRGYLGVGIDDTISGLTHIGAREYDQSTGRFLSADPLIDFADPLQMNGYAYANNSPVSQSDPTGLAPIECAEHGVSCSLGPDGTWDEKKTSEYDKYHPATATELDAAGDPGYAWNTESQAAGDLVTSLAAKHLSGETYWNFMRAYQGELDKIMRRRHEVSSNDKLSTAANICAGPDALDCSGGMDDALKLVELEKAAQAGLFEDGGRLTGAAVSKSYTKKLQQMTPCNSFLPGTEVLMADGSTKPIEEVKVGDEVLAGDPNTGTTRAETVTAEIKGEGLKRLVRVTVETDGGTASVTATDGHPFWSPEKGEWIEAAGLRSDERLQTVNGSSVRIKDLKRWTALGAKVYNLSVSDLHTYYVLAGATPVLVHNSNCNINSLTRAQSDDIAKYLGYTKSKRLSAGKTPIWENKKAGAGQPKFITFDRTGHNKAAVFKGSNDRNAFQSTSSSDRDGTYGLDIGSNGEVLGLKWLKK
ncbi:polymorphic toxin-type HINT domain-containing protein [Streptomyces sp. NPDC088915]|uniref:polymorphic toxin-type HINT domain-containing protein n=1 Tax=Streptomyces sp. NPDC088915 TaxID=3365912 RepID=UPI00380C6227